MKLTRCIVCRFFTFAADVKEHMRALDTLLELDWTHLITGHYDTPASRDDSERYKEYVEDAAALMIEAVAANPIDSISLPAGLQTNRLLCLSQLQRTAVDACYEKLIAKWSKVLGGVDVFGYTHCYAMWSFAFLDNGS